MVSVSEASTFCLFSAVLPSSRFFYWSHCRPLLPFLTFNWGRLSFVAVLTLDHTMALQDALNELARAHVMSAPVVLGASLEDQESETYLGFVDVNSILQGVIRTVQVCGLSFSRRRAFLDSCVAATCLYKKKSHSCVPHRWVDQAGRCTQADRVLCRGVQDCRADVGGFGPPQADYLAGARCGSGIQGS